MSVKEEPGNPSTLRCLICKQHLKVDGFLFHLYSYFNYNRHRCEDCQFACNSDEQRTFHRVSTTHNITKHTDEYIEAISAQILADCYKAATTSEQPIAVERVLQPQFSYEVSRSISHTENANVRGSTERKIAKSPVRLNQKRRKTSANRFPSPSVSKIAKTAPSDSQQRGKNSLSLPAASEKRSVVENDVSFKTEKDVNQSPSGISGTSPTTSRRTYLLRSSKQRQPAVEPEETSSPSVALTLHQTLQSMIHRPRTKCAKCSLEIDEAYIVRRTHALENHCSNKNDPEIAELLAEEMRLCFPTFTAYSDLQCNICGRKINRKKGRREHVMRQHLDELYYCVIRPCTYYSRSMRHLKNHIQFRHGRQYLLNTPENATVWWELEEMQHDFNCAFEQKLSQCFPCPIPPVTYVGSDILNGVPRASATEKVACLLRDIVQKDRVGTSAQRSINSSESSSADSCSDENDDDVQIIEPEKVEKTVGQKDAATREVRRQSESVQVASNQAMQMTSGEAVQSVLKEIREVIFSGTVPAVISEALAHEDNHVNPIVNESRQDTKLMTDSGLNRLQ